MGTGLVGTGGCRWALMGITGYCRGLVGTTGYH